MSAPTHPFPPPPLSAYPGCECADCELQRAHARKPVRPRMVEEKALGPEKGQSRDQYISAISGNTPACRG